MGQTSSNIAKKVLSPLTGWHSSDKESSENDAQIVAPFIFTRKSSMFLDEDGDLAHEFYEETFDKRRNKRRMRRCWHNLTPQGEVTLPQPCLHWDFPIILLETSR